jgi:TetR/AcrR family transcriptional regulator
MSQPRERHDVSDISVREKMLSSAMELFNRKGYASTTVREIVAESGVTKPVLYYYFGNKEGIYRELMRPPFVKLEGLLVEFQKSEGPAKRLLIDLCVQLLALFIENIEVARIMYSIYYGPSQGAPFIDFDAYHTRLHDTMRQLVASGMKRGEFGKGDLESITWALMGANTIAMEVELSHPERGLGRKGLTRVLEVILLGVERKGQGAKKQGHGARVKRAGSWVMGQGSRKKEKGKGKELRAYGLQLTTNRGTDE